MLRAAKLKAARNGNGADDVSAPGAGGDDDNTSSGNTAEPSDLIKAVLARAESRTREKRAVDRISLASSAGDVSTWLLSNGFPVSPFEGLAGDQLLELTHDEVKERAGGDGALAARICTAFAPYRRRTSFRKA
jgi:hypothetical protein